jgi:hypothetical protein
VSSNPVHGVVYSIQHYVIKFVSDLRQVGGFLRVLQFPPPIKLKVAFDTVIHTCMVRFVVCSTQYWQKLLKLYWIRWRWLVQLQVSSCENYKYIHIDDILLTLIESIIVRLVVTQFWQNCSHSCETIYTEKRQFLRALLVQLYA